jgi:hypothetical protein
MKKLALWAVMVIVIIVAYVSAPVVLTWILIVGTVGAVVATALYGLAVTIVHEPLRSLSDMSIFGSRMTSLVKAIIGTVALLFTTLFAWLVGVELDMTLPTANRVMDVFREAGQVLLYPITLFAFFWWLTLSVDLLRIGRIGRETTLTMLMRRAAEIPILADFEDAGWPVRAIGRAILWFGRKLLSEWWWILLAFYMAPPLVGIGIVAVIMH